MGHLSEIIQLEFIIYVIVVIEKKTANVFDQLLVNQILL